MARSDRELDRRSFLKAAGGATAAAMTTSASGCLGSITGGGGTLTWSRGSHSQTLDFQNTTSGEDVKVTNQVYEQLIQFEAGSGGALTEGLATDWELSGTTVSLTLREGVDFHNGEEFTADDFKATYRRFVDEDYEHFPGSEYASVYGPYSLGGWIDTINVAGDYELEIELTQQYAPMLRNLAMFAASVHSKTAIEEKGTDLKTDPVGTGPFELETLDDENQRVLLTANDNYWGEGPELAEVVFDTIGENSTRAQSLDSGESDIIDGIGAQALSQIENSDNAELRSKAGINIGYLAFNMEAREEFRSKEVRQAISYAVDTQSIVEDVFSGIAEQADQPLPPNVMGYNEDLDPYPHDPDQAQSLLEDAGYGDGFSFELATFKNPRGYNPSPVQAAQTVRSNLQDVGIEVSINQQSFGPFLDYTSAGNHDACFLGWYTDNADPDNFLYSLLHPGVESPDGQDWVSFETEGFNTLDVAAWANQEYMTLVEEAQTSYDTATRRQKYKQANEIAHEEAPWVFLDYAKTLRGVHNRVSNYTVSSIGGPYLKQVTVDSS
jgi:peptide/nickel transport system substrate-binding protein